MRLVIPPGMRILLPWERLMPGDYSGWSDGECLINGPVRVGGTVAEYLASSIYNGPGYSMIVCFLRAE